MFISGSLFSAPFLLSFSLIWLFSLWMAASLGTWKELRAPEPLHLFLGTTLGLILLWQLKAGILAGLSYHLLLVTAVTLMLGWSQALLATSLAALAVAANQGEWMDVPINAVINGLLPATLTQLFLILARKHLPRHFFVFVLINGFAAGGISTFLSGLLGILLLTGFGSYSWNQVSQTFLPFFPLMLIPEAFMNGWALTVLVCWRPQWVRTFIDQQYLDGQ